MVFVGAFIAGKKTAGTMGSGILPSEFMDFTVVSIALFSIAVTMLISNISGIPQSTSQAAVLALAAPALYFGRLDTHNLFVEIIPAWFILPIISYFLSFFAGKYIYQPMRRRGLTIQRAQNENKRHIWDIVLVIMALYVSFAIGSNNVANAAGPLYTMTINELHIRESDHIVILMLATLVVAPCFGIGASLFGHKILKNTGKEIILFGKFEAVIIAFISGSLLLLASVVKGIPTSLVQVNVAAILGIGVAKMGHKNIFRKTQVKRFFTMWMIAPVISFLLSLLLIFLADKANLLQ